LKRLIKKHRLTDIEAAERLGVSRQALSTWYGKTSLTEKVKAQVCELLGEANNGNTERAI
jgi:transcriptional regulator with XRE-family HTH domain